MSALLRKGTWVGIAVAAFAAGAAVIHGFVVEPRIALADPPTHEVVSRALDSEMEISPSLAARKDGALAVAWIASTGGRDAGGRYVGVRVSEPVGKSTVARLGPLVRVRAPDGAAISEATVVALGGDFVVVFLAGGNVYSARVSRDAASAPALVAGHATSMRAAASGANAYVAFAWDEGGKKGVALATSHDAATFARRELGAAGSDFLAVCGDDHTAVVAVADEKRITAYEAPIDPEGPTGSSDVAAFGEHFARTSPACFVNGQDAFVVYAITDKPADANESVIADSLVFARSKDAGKNFLTRAPHRPSSHVLLPTIAHTGGTFTLLGVMGAAVGDAHASASVIVLSADGRSQNGLTRTVIAPVTMATSADTAGFMGDSLGVADVDGATWAAVVDNASGESHVALASVL